MTFIDEEDAEDANDDDDDDEYGDKAASFPGVPPQLERGAQGLWAYYTRA